MMPKSIAPSESRLAGMPTIVSPRDVPRSDSGIRIATMNAARRFPKKMTSTTAARSAPSSGSDRRPSCSMIKRVVSFALHQPAFFSSPQPALLPGILIEGSWGSG